MGTSGLRSHPFSKERNPISEDLLHSLAECIQEVGTFGEVHLVIRNGQVRFMRSVKSVAIARSSQRTNYETELAR
jgi:hypothetical protein